MVLNLLEKDENTMIAMGIFGTQFCFFFQLGFPSFLLFTRFDSEALQKNGTNMVLYQY